LNSFDKKEDSVNVRRLTNQGGTRGKDKGECAVPGCGEPVKWRGLCGACLSWLYRWSHKPPSQWAGYQHRVERQVTRIGQQGFGKVLAFKRQPKTKKKRVV